MTAEHIGYPIDLKTDDHGMLTTVKNVGIF